MTATAEGGAAATSTKGGDGSGKLRITWRQPVVVLAAIAVVGCADPRLPTFVAGCIIVAFAWALRIWSFGHLEKNQVLVTTGPYAHCRNPAYFGSFLALVGTVVAAGNWQSPQGIGIWAFGIVGIAVFLVAYLPRKFRREYPRLQKLFGDQVDRHAANVPDFWPRLRPWRSGDDRRFSLRRAWDNNEAPWGPVLATLMVAIWFAQAWSPLYLLDLLPR